MSVPTIYGSVLCDGTEENFLECERTVYYETQCQENDHVYGGVMCQSEVLVHSLSHIVQKNNART